MINLTDTTFTIPIRIDSPDRADNVRYIIEYIQSNFNTNIIVYENGPEQVFNKPSGIIHIFVQNDDFFHRTQYLNVMAKLARTPFIANYDCDVIFPADQVEHAVEMLRKDKIDMVYPYDGLFVNLPREMFSRNINGSLIEDTKLHMSDLSLLDPSQYHNFGTNSMGGAVFFNKEKFIKNGMENENCKSWGCEDWERFYRFNKLGMRIGRVKGPLYHIEHSRSVNSNESNPYYNSNYREFAKIENMEKEALAEYIKTWPWLS